MNTHVSVHANLGIPLGNKNKVATDTRNNNVDESQTNSE